MVGAEEEIQAERAISIAAAPGLRRAARHLPHPRRQRRRSARPSSRCEGSGQRGRASPGVRVPPRVRARLPEAWAPRVNRAEEDGGATSLVGGRLSRSMEAKGKGKEEGEEEGGRSDAGEDVKSGLDKRLQRLSKEEVVVHAQMRRRPQFSCRTFHNIIVLSITAEERYLSSFGSDAGISPELHRLKLS